jgi:SAM-dependent methyltransferase
VAQREARRRGFDARFHLRSFDEPAPAAYDAIVAIETLIHSPDLTRTLRNLAAALVPGGKLLIVDDLSAADVPAHDAALLANHWGIPHLWSEDDYAQAFADAGLRILQTADLTDRVRPRDLATLAAAERRYLTLQRRLPLPPARAVLNAYLGGIALERLYATGALRYRLFVAGR